MKENRFLWLLLFAVLLTAWAGQEVLRLELSSYRVVQTTNEKGEKAEAFLPAVSAAPGEVLEWRLRAANLSKKVLHDVSLVIPIPKGTRYLPGSAAELHLDDEIKVRPEFSFDGGATFAYPPLFKKVIVEENGIKKEKRQEVKPEEYTHARWLLPALAPGQIVNVRLRTVVR